MSRVCRLLPPRRCRGAASTSSTRAPGRLASRAAHRPALPPPTTRTSYTPQASGRLAYQAAMPDIPAPLVSLVIPAYDEEQRLPGTLAGWEGFLVAQPYPAEVLVVDDGSRDGTA